MTFQHKFRDSLAVGDAAEEQFIKLVEACKIDYGDVRKDPRYQCQGIDFLLRNLLNVPEQPMFHSYDVKYDARSTETGNIAIETVSVMRNGVIEKQGWLYTTKAEWIVYAFINEKRNVFRLVFYTPKELKEIAKKAPRRVVRNQGYESEVAIYPLSNMRGLTYFHLINKGPNPALFEKIVVLSQKKLHGVFENDTTSTSSNPDPQQPNPI
jgi:hypothetical protein